MNAPKSSSRASGLTEIRHLRQQLQEAKATLIAIQNGDVDAVVVPGKRGPRVFTLEGAEHAYRLLIESINEGALTLTTQGVILYANQRFADMLHKKLEKIIGTALIDLTCEQDRKPLSALLKTRNKKGSKIQVQLKEESGLALPVQISMHPLAKNGFDHEILTMVVTDMTESRKNEIQLRALAHRVIQVQEEERKYVALELHDGITQLLCGILFRSQGMLTKIKNKQWPAQASAQSLCNMVADTVQEVSRISHHLRPSVLDHLGLVASLRETCKEFKMRTDVAIDLKCMALKTRLHADIELAFYRILQEALRNIEKHADARHVKVRLNRIRSGIQLSIQDDGLGFRPKEVAGLRESISGLGLLGMRERMATLGGNLKVVTGIKNGVTILARVPG
jgi:two-component system, NarL family, sensor kinase